MADHNLSIDEMCGRMQLEEEEEGGLLLDNIENEGQPQDLRWCLVGRFLSDRQVNFVAMKNTLASIWRPVKGVFIKDLGPNLFYFSFSMNWIYREFKQMVPLFHVELWIQVFELLFGFMTENVGKSIGNFIGVYIGSDQHSFVGVWQNYMRIRVAFDIRTPLKRVMKLRTVGGEWVWIHFKYERLPMFCFYCGFIGHSDKFCAKLFNNPIVSEERAYGSWLRAPSRKQQNQTGGQWLRMSFPMKNSGQNQEGDGSYFSDKNCSSYVPCNQVSDINHQVSFANYEEVTGGSSGFGDMAVNYDKSLILAEMDKGNIQNFVAGKGKELATSENKRRRTEDKENLVEIVPDMKQHWGGTDLHAESVETSIYVSSKAKGQNQKNLLAVGSAKLESLKIKLGYEGLLAVSSTGHGGGLAMFWKKKDMAHLLSYSSNHIHVMKRGGTVHPDRLLAGFRSALNDCGLKDLGISGYPSTWERERGSSNWVEDRLDRCLVSQSWHNLFPNYKVWNLESSMSDHSPIFMDIGRFYRIKRVRRFRFENAWLREKDCRDIVETGWSKGLNGNLSGKIESCGAELFKWGELLRSSFNKRIQEARIYMKKYRGLRDEFSIV
ncbi:hypothetical protein DH2020_024431 [Rehmannia glutinosa]|uniref:CCHC-type domain-containing protein n=1 Tax=Rehmannia glutinosa TaxID=99300 RepID=A0ABR0W6U5_REHGL